MTIISRTNQLAHRPFWLGLAFSAALAPVVATTAGAQSTTGPVVTPGFTLTVFATPPAGSSKPDSIAVVDQHVWIGYGDGHAPDGSDGLSNEIVEYSSTGKALRTISVKGHNDGLRLDPYTNLLWAIQNEDATPQLVVIDPVTGKTQTYNFPPPLHGGGYDDVQFINGKAYVSASNPTLDAHGHSRGPSIVSVTLNPDFTISVAPVLSGRPTAIDIPSGRQTTLNLTDPDSLTVTPSGDLLLDDQGDAQLILLRLSQTQEPPVQYLPLLGGVQVDDTIFVNSTEGYLLITDTGGNTTYKLTAPVWTPGAAFSASTGVPASGSVAAIPGYVGALDVHSGALYPAVTNLVAPHGLAFVAQ